MKDGEQIRADGCADGAGKTAELFGQETQWETTELFSDAISGGLAGAYLEPGLPLCFVSDQLLDCLEYNYETFADENGGLLLRAIHPDDRDGFCAQLERQLTAGGYEACYRMRKRDGTYLWMTDMGKRIHMQEGRPAVVSLRMEITAAVQARERREKLENKIRVLTERNTVLSTLTSDIPGGVCVVRLSEGLPILYANKSFYLCCGYTAGQMAQELGDRLTAAIFAEDRVALMEALCAARRQGRRSFETEQRIRRRDGTVRWVLVRGNLVCRSGLDTANCVVLDITRRRVAEQELRINEERFRIALTQTDSTLYDYDIQTRVMTHADKSAALYGLPKQTENVPDALVERGVVHPDSAEDFFALYRRIGSGERSVSGEILIRMYSGRYVWRKLSMTAIFDGDGRAVRAVGILEDIDERKRREEELIAQSERDPLTGLYNKGATERHIHEQLAAPCVDRSVSVLFVLDIDRFKSVNDRYGHLFGDRVLHESARRIAKLFHADDIVGRIGGDEFIIFMHSLCSDAIAHQRARALCAAFGSPFAIDGQVVEIGCSIGAASAPADGATFEQLYQKADTALYTAKRTGHNLFRSYTPDMAITSVGRRDRLNREDGK